MSGHEPEDQGEVDLNLLELFEEDEVVYRLRHLATRLGRIIDDAKRWLTLVKWLAVGICIIALIQIIVLATVPVPVPVPTLMP